MFVQWNLHLWKVESYDFTLENVVFIEVEIHDLYYKYKKKKKIDIDILGLLFSHLELKYQDHWFSYNKSKTKQHSIREKKERSQKYSVKEWVGV